MLPSDAMACSSRVLVASGVQLKMRPCQLDTIKQGGTCMQDFCPCKQYPATQLKPRVECLSAESSPSSRQAERR